MLNLADSSGRIEFLGGGGAAAAFAPAILDTESLLVPTIVICGVLRWLRLRWGEEGLLSAYAALSEGTVVGLEATLAPGAASVSCRHKLPMADSIIPAGGRAYEATIWTRDRHIAGLQGVRYFPCES